MQKRLSYLINIFTGGFITSDNSQVLDQIRAMDVLQNTIVIFTGLSIDRSETNNLAAKFPDIVKDMEQAWRKQAEKLDALAQQDKPSPLKNNGNK